MTGPGGGSDPGAAGAPAAAGSIYDLGYRRYDGPRLGRRHAFWALLAHTLRACYGIGRGGRAKIAPFVLGGMAVIPAIIAVAFVALARQAGAMGDVLMEASPLRYETYFGVIGQIVILFCAAQGPELLVRDQRHQVLSLYFSRTLERADYVLAKLGGFMAAILILVLLPQLVIFAGLTLSAVDVVAEASKNLSAVPPVIAQGLILAALYGALALAISGFTSRRAYATAAVIAAAIVPPVIVQLVSSVGAPEVSRWLILVSPPDIVDATNGWLFGVAPSRDAVLAAGHPGELFVIVAALIVASCAAILLRRYQGIQA
jgi:ABC-2 type transport system permease protein